jgi:outer membrane lipoprotein-sorting protein
MMRSFRAGLALVVSASALLSTACLARRRVITRQGKSSQPVVLLTADKASLLNRIAVQYESIRSLNATVDMVPAVGSVNKGKITEYKDVRAFILFRKPGDIHLIGLYPVVRNKAFDMVSDGKGFRLYLPAQNRFLLGENEIATPSPNKLENLRPGVFLQALLIPALDAASETAVLEDFTDEDNAAYIVQILRKSAAGELELARNVWFERVSLRIVRQQIFDPAGAIAMDVRYSTWQNFDGVPFPTKIDINRPKDEYGIVMTLLKAEINQPIGDDKFVLEQPEGTERRILGTGPGQPVPKPSAQLK